MGASERCYTTLTGEVWSLSDAALVVGVHRDIQAALTELTRDPFDSGAGERLSWLLREPAAAARAALLRMAPPADQPGVAPPPVVRLVTVDPAEEPA